jgi:hypothetical protein
VTLPYLLTTIVSRWSESRLRKERSSIDRGISGYHLVGGFLVPRCDSKRVQSGRHLKIIYYFKKIENRQIRDWKTDPWLKNGIRDFPWFIIKSGKNVSINFVQMLPMILKPCFLCVSVEEQPRKKKVCKRKIPPLLITFSMSLFH